MAFFQKKYFLYVGASVVLVGGLFMLFEYENKPEKIDLASVLLSSTSTQGVSGDIGSIDSDHDGLKDWEEVLWKTDPHNPDTDGDGTPDGEEVAEGRDPAKKGPDDKIQNVKAVLSDNSANTPNETNALTEKFLTEYAALAQAGKLDAQGKEKLIADLVSEMKKTSITAKVFTQSDIIISDDTSTTAIRKYGNAVGEAIAKDAPRKLPDQPYPPELIYIKTALASKAESDIEKIDPIILGYKNMITVILAIPVPKDAVSEHLLVLNGFEKRLSIIEGFRNAFTDPAQAAKGVENYLSSEEEMRAALTATNAYFKNHSVTFSKTEYGYVYTHII